MNLPRVKLFTQGNKEKDLSENFSLFSIPEDQSKTTRDFFISPKKPLSEISSNQAITPTPAGRQKPLKQSTSVSALSKRVVSPRFSLEDLKNDENYPMRLFELPMTGTRVMGLYRSYLTELEAKEIRNYEQVFYFGHKVHKLQDNHTDQQGAYRAVAGDHLAYRYELLELIGRGTFGHVYKCFDYKNEQLVAVKVIRRGGNIRKQGENEVKILEILKELDPDSHNIVQLLSSFEFRNHLCLSFELLSINLYQFLRKNLFQGVSLSFIKRIAAQVLISLKHVHSLGMFHCDLKLENILLKSENKTSIKVVDFGSAITSSNPLYTYLQSRYYRAPEVILACGYDCKVDVWSLGCVLVELFTGRPLFPGDNEKDQLAKIIQVIGPPPVRMAEKSNRKSGFFNETVVQKWTLKDIIRPNEKDEVLFEDFISSALTWDPSERFSAEDALKHPWIRGRESQGKGRLLFNS
jgi:hypothetical protein